MGFTLRTPDGIAVAGTNSRDWHRPGTSISARAEQNVCAIFRFTPKVGGGDYLFSLGVAEDVDGEVRPLDRRYDCLAITIMSPGRTTGLADLGIEFEISTREKLVAADFPS